MCKISTRFIKLYGSWSSIFWTKNLVSQKQKSINYIFVWDLALLNKYYQIIKKSQFYINHLSDLNVWLVSDQGSLVLELNLTIKLCGTFIWTYFFVSSWREFKDF